MQVSIIIVLLHEIIESIDEEINEVVKNDEEVLMELHQKEEIE